MTRFLRMTRSRWWVPTAAAIVGTLAVAAIIAQRNQSIRPVFSAEVGVAVPAAEQQSSSRSGVSSSGGSAATIDLAGAQQIAQDANQELLDSRTGRIQPQSRDNILLFLAQAPTSEDAVSTVIEMRDNYLEALAGMTSTNIEGQIEEIIAEAQLIQGQLEDVTQETPGISAESQGLSAEEQAKIDFIMAQLQALEGRAGKLAVDIILEESERERADLELELSAISDRLVELQEDLTELGVSGTDRSSSNESSESTGGSRLSGTTPADAESLETTWQITALQARLEALQESFQALYLASQTSSIGNQPVDTTRDVTVSNATPRRVPVPLGAGAGLFAGMMVGLVALAADDRLRRSVWAASDLGEAPVLAEMPARGVVPAEPWYWFARPGLRRRGIQALRSAVLTFAEGEPGHAVVGLVGYSTRGADLELLALDLGASLAKADRSVLILDASFGEAGILGQVTPSGTPDLAELLSPEGSESIAMRAKRAFAETELLVSGLAVVPSGSAVIDSIDSLAGRSFGTVLGQARTEFEITLVVGPDVARPESDIIARKVDGLVLVCTAGRTSRLGAGKRLIQFGQQQAPVLGSVLLVGRMRKEAGSSDHRGPGSRLRAVLVRRLRAVLRPRVGPRRPAHLEPGGVERNVSLKTSEVGEGAWVHRSWSFSNDRGRHRRPRSLAELSRELLVLVGRSLAFGKAQRGVLERLGAFLRSALRPS